MNPLFFLDYQFQIERVSGSKLRIIYENQTYPVEIHSLKDELVLLIDDHQFRCRVHIDGDTCTFYSNISRSSFDFKLQPPSFLAKLALSGMGGAVSASTTTGDPIAPMPGIIDKILVKEGTTVKQGQPLLVMTAMKMEHVIKASRNGTIGKVNATAGKVVKKGDILLTYAVDEKKSSSK
jgi:acetyl/propionyl-CoA carboxylase alpha subunit